MVVADGGRSGGGGGGGGAHRRRAQAWAHSTGFINEDMIRRALPAAAGPDAFVGMCGPPPMINFACIPNLERAGWAEENYMSF